MLEEFLKVWTGALASGIEGIAGGDGCPGRAPGRRVRTYPLLWVLAQPR